MSKKSPAEAAKPTGLLVPHTHWDREWRYPIWKNRALLCELMDRLLDILDKQKDYRSFVMDGQCVVIEDYLQVRPENEKRVRKHVKAGRLVIGPWYTLPDLYPIDGECLVRNLLTGVRLSKQYGGCLNIGYNSFGWGQTAQFPQIYAEFGIDFLIAAKTVSTHRARACEYWWEAPDGTRSLATRLGKFGRANGFFNLYIQSRFGMQVGDPAYFLQWGRGGPVTHNALADQAYRDYFRIAHEEGYYPEMVRKGIEATWAAMDDTAVPDYRMLMTGSDSTCPQDELGRIIRDANEMFPDRHFEHSTLQEYAKRLREIIDGRDIKLDVIKGELRDGPPQATSANALATRMYIKLANKLAENALIRQAEPLAATVAMLGWKYPRTFLDLAWRYLLLSHPHDSINGVTQDKTADDVMHHLAQARELAEVVHEDATSELIRRIDLSGYEQSDILLVVTNPLPWPVRDVVKLAVDTPQADNLWDIGVQDAAGNALPVQHMSRQSKTVPVSDLYARPWPFELDRHVLWLDTGEVPAGGYKVLKVTRGQTFYRKCEFWAQTPARGGAAIGAAPNVLENEHLRVEVRADGTFDLTDRSAGATITGMHWFEDTGDIGDYWIYYAPRENRTYTSKGGAARIWMEDNGPLAATLAIEIRMDLPTHATRPENYVRGPSARAAETRPLVITSRLTLKAGSRRLDVRTTVENTVSDHRLRVVFPTGVKADEIDASGHFTVDRRPAVTRDPDGNVYEGMQTLPMQYFVDASDGQRGLAVLNNCFTEYEALQGEATSLAITLFRAVKNIICTEWRSAGAFPDQDGGQCLRTMEYAYAVYPHDGNWESAGTFAAAARHNTPPSVTQTWPHKLGRLPVEGSLLSVEGKGLVLSAVKQATERRTYIVRVCNPGSRTVTGRLTLARKVVQAWRANCNEERIEPIAPDKSGGVRFKAAPGKIVTIEAAIE
jgi:mannosylglycerate hydrolase